MKALLFGLACIIVGCAGSNPTASSAHPSASIGATGATMNKIIHLSAHLECDAACAYEMFTSTKRLESWLTTKAEVEPKTGGKYELFWDPTSREDNSTIGCHITAIVPDQLIAFEWRSPKQFKHFANQADPLTHVVVTFSPSANGTDVHLVHSGWRSTPDWEQARQWQERAWSMALESLQKEPVAR